MSQSIPRPRKPLLRKTDSLKACKKDERHNCSLNKVMYSSFPEAPTMQPVFLNRKSVTFFGHQPPGCSGPSHSVCEAYYSPNHAGAFYQAPTVDGFSFLCPSSYSSSCQGLHHAYCVSHFSIAVIKHHALDLCGLLGPQVENHGGKRQT